MIRGIRQRLLRLRYFYLDPIDRQRAESLVLVNWLVSLIVLVLLGATLLPLVTETSYPVAIDRVVTLVLTFALHVVVFWQLQTGRLRWARRLFVTVLVANVALMVISPAQTENTAILALMTIPLVAAGMLLNRGGLVLVMVVMLAVALYGGIVQGQDETPIVSGEALIVLVATLGVITSILYIFRGRLVLLASETLAELQQHRWIMSKGLEIGSLESEQSVLARALEAIRVQYQYLSALVYLVDEGGTFSRMMRAGSSDIETIGREGLGLGDANIINEALRSREAWMTSSDDPLPRRSHLLPAATFGSAIPIRHGGEILGVLDVQKAGIAPFSQDEITSLLLFADQLGVALWRAQTVTDLERSLRERESANQHLQSQLSEYQQRERQSVVDSWGAYLDGQGKTAIGYNIEPDNTPTPIPANDLPEPLHNTLKSGTVQVEMVGDERVINVPIAFRDQTLGAMSFAIPRDQELSERQIEMARIVAERLALALENTRLFEQSQAQALRERKASEISSLLIGATDVHSVLNLAAENFNEALGAIHTRIYIQPDMLAEPLATTTEHEEL